MLRAMVSLLLLLPLFLMSTAAKAPGGGETITLTADNVIVMDMEYTSETVAKVALQAREMDSKLASWKPIYLVILSPGGDIEAGVELIDNLNAIDRKIHTVTLFSASMAFQNVQGVPGTRYITRGGTLMAHKARGGFQGEFPGQLDSRYAYWTRRLTKLDEITVSRANGKLTLESYRAAYENEYWCEGQDCVDAGFADQVVSVACDKSLDGTKTITETLSFLGMPVEVSITKAACPTITGVLDLTVKANGEQISPENIDSVTKKLKLSPQNANELRQVVERKIETLAPSRNSQIR